MRLFFAEKKEVGQAIADALGYKNSNHYSIELNNGDVVTWLSGHILELTQPEEHNGAYKRWSINDLPLDWPVTYKPIERHQERLKVINDLAQKADVLVNAGDPDPEGQRLVDEVIEHLGLQNKPCKRILINDNNAPAIQKAVANMEDNAKYHGLSMSALARAVSDMRYGINLTRLYTIKGQQAGFQGVLSVGRVQTPILGLVVNRDRENAAHSKQAFYKVSAELALSSSALLGQYLVQEADPQDEKKRLNDKTFASALADQVNAKPGAVKSVSTADKQTFAPLLYNLLELQADAAGNWKLKPDEVLAITQSLRDKHRAITYNRSDCRYLNDERHDDAPALLSALGKLYANETSQANPQIKSKAFDSSKVSAHHAIIPTESVPDLDRLTEHERHIYELIARSYIAQFYEPEKYRETTVIFTVEGKDFQVKGRVDVSPGWKTLYASKNTTPEDETAEEDGTISKINLESIKEGDTGQIQKAQSAEVFTKPKPLYTMKTLLKDLSSVAKYVTDPKIKALLLDKDEGKQSEKGGIGTSATRDKMLITLLSRGFLLEKGNNLISSEVGKQFHDALPDFAVKPDLTALWHEKQKEIEAGRLDYQALVAEVDQAIAEEITRAESQDMTALTESMPKCTKCGKVITRRKGEHGFFWSCTGWPDCKTTYQDNKGKPQLTTYDCPKCGQKLSKRKGKDGKSDWWGCTGWPDCKATYQDNKGKPQLTTYDCPTCGKQITKRKGKDGKSDWWGCTGWPNCTTTYKDNKGKPAYE